MTIEDDLRSALHDHADHVEPSNGGLERIQARLVAPETQRPRLAPRLMAAAALLVAVGAVAALTIGNGGDGTVEVAGESSTTDPSAAAVINDLPPSDDGDDDTGAGSNGSDLSEGTSAIPYEDIPAAPAGVLGPREATPQEAIESFLGLIQRSGEDITIEIQRDLALISRVGEGGGMVDVATLHLGSVELADGETGFVVIKATSSQVKIDSPTDVSVNNGAELTVSGRGAGFEGQVNLNLYSSDDGVELSQGYASAGNFGRLAPFEAELDVFGPGPAWVVVQSSGATETRLDPFAAVPVVLDAPRASPNYVVTNIPVGDPDGGLVVRSLPGTDGAQLTVLPAGESRINKRTAFSVFIGDGEPNEGQDSVTLGDQEWWNIWLPTPLEGGRQWGWVNSAYLTVDTPVAAADLEAIAWQFVAGLVGDDAVLAALPWSPGGVTVGPSNDLFTTTNDKAANPGFWQETFSFAAPQGFTGTLDGNLRQILSPTKTALTPETAVGVGVVPVAKISAYPAVNDALAARFPGASIVQLTDPTNDGSGWRFVNLFVQQGAAGPEIVGIVAVDWTP